jgi:tetratricopeptide (TPR) repeat protein
VIQQGEDKVDLSNYARAYAMYAGAKGMLAHYGGIFSKAIDGLAVKTNLDKAQKLKPDSPAVLFGLGSYYLLAPVVAGGNKAKAEEYLNKTVETDPLFADVYVRLAQLARIKGDKKKYDYYLNKALETDPGNELALDTLSGRCKFICTGGEE